jgi:hypothetical protein
MDNTNSTVAPVNPMVEEENPFETLHHVRSVMTFIRFTVPGLISNGSNDQATHGLAMVLECAGQALDHAMLKLAQTEGAHHG